MKGFTLIELMVVVAILGILGAVGIPIYTGYVANSEIVVVQNNLRSIYLQQQDYFSNNAAYYTTGAICGDFSGAINANLFAGRQVIAPNGYNYCILQAAITDFQARAEDTASATVFTIDETNAANF